MKSTAKKTIAAVVAVAAMTGGLLVTEAPAWAHHSYAMFDQTKTSTVNGTVRTFQWTNPHVYLWIYGPDGKGDPNAVWAFEFGGGPNGLARNGWTKNTMKPGDKVTVTYAPLRDGRTGGLFRNAKKEDGVTWDSRGVVPEGGRKSQGPGAD